MLFNTFLSSSTKKIFPHWLSNSMYDLSPESFKSLQATIQKLRVWPMTDELQKQQQDSLPWENHIALVSLQGWTRAASREKNKIIFILQYGTSRSNPTTDHSMHYVQLNSGRSLWHRQFVLPVSRLSWLSREELGSCPRARGSHLHKLFVRTWHMDGEANLTGCLAPISVDRSGD